MSGIGKRPSANSLELFEHSIPTNNPKTRLSIDENGNIHRFFNDDRDGSGTFHWSGSTGDKINPIKRKDLDKYNDEIKQLRVKK